MNQNNTEQQYHTVFLWILLSLLMFSVLNPEVAEASPRWAQMQGEPICGGIVNDTLQAGCSNKRATRKGKAVAECPDGSFLDVGNWTCHSCPSGYDRTTFSVTEAKACSKDVNDIYKRASYKTKQQCPAHTFLDGRNGGECWKCPGGTGRTLAGVDEWNACAKGLEKAVSANFRGKACKDGSFADPRNGGECWICPAGFHRTGEAVNHAKACVKTEDFKVAEKEAALTCPAGQDFDFIDGGTCWSCPTGYKRSLDSVKSNKACENEFLEWAAPEPTMPGLFGLKGAEAIAIELVNERTKIDKAIENAAEKADNDTEEWNKEEWDRIKTKPWESPILTALVFEVALTAAIKPVSKRSRAEKDLLKSVSENIQHHRLFVATQAMQSHDNSMAAGAKLMAIMSSGSMHSVYAASPASPDYEQITQTIVGSAGLGMMGVGVITTMTNLSARAAFMPFRVSVQKALIAGSKEVLGVMGHGTKTLSAVSSAAAGPLLILTGAVLVAQMGIDIELQNQEVEGKLRQAIDQATGKLDLALFMEQEGAFEQLSYHWAGLMDGTTRPSNKFVAAANAGNVITTESGHVIVVDDAMMNSGGLEIDSGDPEPDVGLSDELTRAIVVGYEPPTPTPNTTPPYKVIYTAAITLENGNTYLFDTGGFYSKTSKSSKKGFDKGYPKKMPGGWKKFPKSWHSGIDAAMASKGVTKGVTPYLWKDGQYITLLGVTRKGNPKKMPGVWKKMPKDWDGDVDAAVYLAKENKHYLFKGKQFVRITKNQVDHGYPKDLAKGWRLIPDDYADGIDAATYRDGRVYMIRGDEYIRFSNRILDRGYPKKIKDSWPE